MPTTSRQGACGSAGSLMVALAVSWGAASTKTAMLNSWSSCHERVVKCSVGLLSGFAVGQQCRGSATDGRRWWEEPVGREARQTS